VDAKITPGAKGQFDVMADGRLTFSKQAKGRFPENGEVVSLLDSPR
jgi:predicted Rdx family selenoprotein